MPHVLVKLWPGKSAAQKQRLADDITDAICKRLGYGPDSVSVAFEEVAAKDWREKVYLPDIVEGLHELVKEPGYSM